MITVKDLITYLNTFPQDIPVAYYLHSEQCLLDIEDIEIVEKCEPRKDGWIQNKRPDMPSRQYVIFPGN